MNKETKERRLKILIGIFGLSVLGFVVNALWSAPQTSINLILVLSFTVLFSVYAMYNEMSKYALYLQLGRHTNTIARMDQQIADLRTELLPEDDTLRYQPLTPEEIVHGKTRRDCAAAMEIYETVETVNTQGEGKS